MMETPSENIGWDPLRVDLLWDLKDRPSRGPKPTLTVKQIAKAGIAIADRDGLGALSMQRLAEALGVGTMSLYTYVPDKASLLEVMIDAAFEFPTPISIEGDWRTHLENAALAILAAYERHPWALEIFIGGPPIGPNQMRFLEGALQSLDETPLDDEETLDTVMAVTAYVRGAAHLSIGVTRGEAQSGLNDEQLQALYRQAYERVLDRETFPITHRLLASSTPESSESAATESGYDFGFRFGLTRLLDGIESHIASKSVNT